MPEVMPEPDEIEVLETGRAEFARGEFVRLKDIRLD
jgi:hypothetical protein